MSLSSQFSSDHSLSIVLSLQPTGQLVLKPRPGPGPGLGISVGLILSVHSQAKLVIVKINPQHCNKIFPLEVEIKIHVC